MQKEKLEIEYCEFHSQKVCSCGQCKSNIDFTCEGKSYCTTYKLMCPLHSLLYTIECNARANIAAQLIHPSLKRGHSNFVEASHSILTRYRPKDVYLNNLHYEVSGLLKSNMTYMNDYFSKNTTGFPNFLRS